MEDELMASPNFADAWHAKYERMQKLVCASRWRRLATFLIDHLCYIVCYFLLVVLMAALFGTQGLLIFRGTSGYLVDACIYIAYYAFLEGIWGRTPGKFCVGTRVVNEVGERASFPQILGRSVMRLVPFDAFSFFLKIGWHDRASNTRVILNRAQAEPEPQSGEVTFVVDAPGSQNLL